MKHRFSATVWRDGDWYVAQCLILDIVSQGEAEEAVLDNLKEELEFYFDSPQSTIPTRQDDLDSCFGSWLAGLPTAQRGK